MLVVHRNQTCPRKLREVRAFAASIESPLLGWVYISYLAVHSRDLNFLRKCSSAPRYRPAVARPGSGGLLRLRSDAENGRMRAASWLRDFRKRSRVPRCAHLNGLDVGHGAPRGRKMPSATSFCSRCGPAKIIAGINHGGSGTAWPARGAMRGHRARAAAAATRQKMRKARGMVLQQFVSPRSVSDALEIYEG